MRSRTPDADSRRALILAAILLLLLLLGCAATTSAPSSVSDAALADRLEKLPMLPADIAATLDPKTHATKTAGLRRPVELRLHVEPLSQPAVRLQRAVVIGVMPSDP